MRCAPAIVLSLLVALVSTHAAMPADQGTVASVLSLTRATLAFVQESTPLPELEEEFRSLEKRMEASDDQEEFLNELRGLRRRIILSHPLLGFDDLLINKRPVPAFSHQSDQYLGRHSGAGDGLVVLRNWKDQPTEEVLLRDRLPVGSVLHPDLSYDSHRILFSFCDHSEPRKTHRRFFIYEINTDGSGLRQLTGTSADPLEGLEDRRTALIEDFDPCYLPDGRIAFVSTRNQGGVRCHHGGRYCMTYTLYGCDGNGFDIRPIAYGEANEWDPSVMNDGRIIWCRWDYINRHDTIYQGLWTTKPDGTSTAHYYGNYTRNPCLTSEAKAIPGSRLICATAGAHHGYISGSIVLIDPAKGRDGEAPLQRITPEASFPETEGWHEKAYCTPYPLSENLFLAAYTPGKITQQGRNPAANAYAIYLIDTLGGRELVYRDPKVSCFAPIPLQPRKKQPALPSILPDAPDGTPGTFYVQNVYESSGHIPKGSVKRLRIVQIYPQPAQRAPDRSKVLFELPKRIIGTVPVDENGSVAFEAPSGVPLLFQLLDKNNMCVMSMRTFVYAHPGETTSCVGCHEPRDSAPSYRSGFNAAVHKPVPPAGPQYAGGLSFTKTVQPVLDRHCIRCHGLGEELAGGINLLGTLDESELKLGRVKASTAYRSLAGNPHLVSMALRNEEAVRSTPKDYFSHAGALAPMLLEGGKEHEPLDQDSFQRVVDWLDLNGQFYGSYSWNKDEWRRIDPEAERKLREHIAQTFGEEWAVQPFAALVNVALPSESRILMAPLALDAGGWGQVTNGWESTADAGYKKMAQAVEKCIQPLESSDRAGTCNQIPCKCKSCWVAPAEAEYRKRLNKNKPL